MKIAAVILALGTTLTLAAPAQALVSFVSSIEATLSATALPEGVRLDYGFSSYDGYARGQGVYDAGWSDDFTIEGPSLSFTPSVHASTDALAVIEAASLTDGSVTLENLSDAISTVDFVLSYDLRAETTVDGGPEAISKAYATLMVETLEARPSVSRSVDIYAGGAYGPALARETGAWTFSIVLNPGQRMNLVVYADAMGYLEDTVSQGSSPVPLPGAAPLAAAGLASLGGVAALRRRRRSRG
ncbi:hypothetical protein [Albimonas pacifica]|uniref:VPLPA-CTERM protein sorting domain-containing protein n=1 Tax=Albimonas pacifica TaxID=1114924 RepID=A0A1I3DVV8_9RHOB|nr:hypothetical protein [Albimonas pacifica]SFH90835.1 hypothetical protein SAMN05216258_10342 [Albimonas pacifica]